MNIIEAVKKVLTEYPNIADLINDEVHIDFTEENSQVYGLSSVNDKQIKEDILGNQVRSNNFVLYVTNYSVNDYERLQNSTLIYELALYLETIKDIEIDTTVNNAEYCGKITQMSCANGMAWSKSQDGQIYTYQLQINAIYTLERR